MARRLQRDKLISKNNIKEPLYLLFNSNTDYITKTGKIYKLYEKDLYYPKKSYVNKVNNYVYIGITNKQGVNINCRLHILLAIMFIPNPKPDLYNIVGHKDNDKTNYSLENLYWTNTSENTKKAFDDKLAYNAKGIDDSQSQPIKVYRNDGTCVSVYGSISQAARCIEGYSKNNIAQMLDKSKKGRKGYYFRSITKEEFYNYKGNKNLEFKVATN